MAETTKDTQISLRVPTELKERIVTYSQLTGRSKSHVAMEAIAHYLDWRTPQMEDLQEAIAAADRGEFSTEAEVNAVFARYASPKLVAPKATKKPPASKAAGVLAGRRARP